MDEDKYFEMLQNAIDSDGLQFALDALQEECAELIQAISHLRRGRCGPGEVTREMADVKLMMDMVNLGMKGLPHFDFYIEQKARTIGHTIQWKEKPTDDQG